MSFVDDAMKQRVNILIVPCSKLSPLPPPSLIKCHLTGDPPTPPPI